MATATRNLSDSVKTKSWMVRNEQGETFGPVDFETLKMWACDGRLAPTNEVSENGTDWQLATSQGGLAMDWVAEVTPGTFYGPIHQAAMADLIKDGSIAARVPFFKRLALDALPVSVPADPQVEHLRQQLKAQGELSKQLAAAHAAEFEQARRQAAAEAELTKQQATLAAAELEQSRRHAADAEAQSQAARRQASEQAAGAAAALEQARLQAEAAETQTRAARQQAAAASAELEKARLQAAEAEAQLHAARLQAAAQAEQAMQQAGAASAELERVRQQAADAEARAGEARRQTAAQAEQARLSQQQLSDRVAALERQLAQARQEQAEAASRLAELQAERETHAAVWTAKEQAFEAEWLSLRSAVGCAQAETATHAERVKHLETALAEAGRAVQDGQAVETQAQVLRSEIESLRSALAEERQRAQQAQTRCATLTETLEEAKQSRSGETRQVTELRDELELARRQAEGLRSLFRQAEAVLGATPAPAPAFETVAAVPADFAAPRPERPKPVGKVVEDAELLPPQRPQSAEKPPVVNRAAQARPGLSMADFEQQARRELERLGAQGTSFFKKKK